MTWIRIPITQRVVVKNDTQQVVRVVVTRKRPIVQCDNYEFYPRTWQGVARQSGEIVTWEFKLGPVRAVKIHTDKAGVRWLLVIWK